VPEEYVDKLQNKVPTFLDISLFRITLPVLSVGLDICRLHVMPVLSVGLDICRLHVMPDDSHNAKEV